MNIFKKLSNLKFAIVLLFIIGLIIAIGTIIEQNQSILFYQENYSVESPLFNFLNWKLILALNLNTIYTAWWFVSLLLLLVISLLSCTFNTQLPLLKNFKIWSFIKTDNGFKKLAINNQTGKQNINIIPYYLNQNNYHFYRQRKNGYAYSGLLGRIAPIFVHFSLVILIIGSTAGSFIGYTAQELIPRGEISHIQNMVQVGNQSYIFPKFTPRVNDFWITYTQDNKVDQFYSDLSILDDQGKELKRKVIFVNEPLIYNGVTIYQTDWDILGLKIKSKNNQIFQIPLKKIKKGGSSFWFGSLTPKDTKVSEFSFVLNNLKGNIILYDKTGTLLKEFTLGENLDLGNNINIKIVDIITGSGLQIKNDPSILPVYLSFLFLLISTYVSFLSYSQIWVLDTPQSIFAGGKSNRAVLFFQEEFRKLLTVYTIKQ